MGKLVDPARDLFNPEEIVHRVPVMCYASGDKAIGTAYISEDEIFIHVRSSTLIREVGAQMELEFISNFVLDVAYTPVRPAEETSAAQEKLTPEGWMYKLRRVWNYEDRDGREKEQMTKFQFLEYMHSLSVRGCCSEVSVPREAWGKES